MYIGNQISARNIDDFINFLTENNKNLKKNRVERFDNVKYAEKTKIHQIYLPKKNNFRIYKIIY